MKKITLNLTEDEVTILVLSIFHYKNIFSPWIVREKEEFKKWRKVANSLDRKLYTNLYKIYKEEHKHE